MKKSVIGFVFLSLIGSTALAASVPNTFVSGQTANAADVNANFAALVTAVTTLETQVATLEAKVAAIEAKVGPHTMASLAGTYDVFEISAGIDIGTCDAISCATFAYGTSVAGSVVLNADGTGSESTTRRTRMLTTNLAYTQPNPVDFVTMSVSDTPEAQGGSFNWTYSGGIVTVVGGPTFTVAGQILIDNIQSTGGSSGKNGIFIMVRR